MGSSFNRLRLHLERGVLQIAAWSMWDRNFFASCSSRRDCGNLDHISRRSGPTWWSTTREASGSRIGRSARFGVGSSAARSADTRGPFRFLGGRCSGSAGDNAPHGRLARYSATLTWLGHKSPCLPGCISSSSWRLVIPASLPCAGPRACDRKQSRHPGQTLFHIHAEYVGSDRDCLIQCGTSRVAPAS